MSKLIIPENIFRYIAKSFVVSAVFVSSLFAQNDAGNQSIELPAFVITGIRAVSVPIMKKKKTEFIPIVDDKFLVPKYDTEDFSLMNNNLPDKKEMTVFEHVKGYNGLLKLGVGTQTVPVGDFYFGFNKKNYLFNSHVYGSNIKEYVPYAGYNTSGAKVHFDYFVDNVAKYFPGVAIGAAGAAKRDQYNFYGSGTPSKLRKNEMYNWKVYLNNKFDKKLQYGLEVNSEKLKMKEEFTDEDLLDFSADAVYKFGAVGFGAKGNYKVQKVNDITGYSRADLYGGMAYLDLNSSNVFEMKIGAKVVQFSDETFVAPVINFAVFVEEGAALFLSYSGNADLITLHSFIKENRYFEKDITRIFQKKYSDIKVAVKYDFKDVFEINAGFHSAKYVNYHYFEDFNNDNRFNIGVAENVDEMGGFINALINIKKYGEFFADFEFQNITDIYGNKIPYKPMILADFSYGYLFNFGVYTKAMLNYSRYSYTNLINTQRTTNYINLGLLLKYNLFKMLAVTCNFQNLLNRKDYLLKNYQEKPLDIIVGIEYRW